MADASDAILALKPVTFHYKKDPNAIPQFGLVAEDVEAIDPDLVVRDKEGQANSVRYEAVNAMLLNEFLKEHRTMRRTAKDDRRAKIRDDRPRSNGEGTSSANPKGERTARSEETCAASG